MKTTRPRRESHDQHARKGLFWQVVAFVLSEFDTLLPIVVGATALVLSQFGVLAPNRMQDIVLVLLVLIAIHLLRRHEPSLDRVKKEIQGVLARTPGDVLEYTPNGEANYRLAIARLLLSERVCATYFLRRSWEEKPANLQDSSEFIQYFKTLNDRIVSGRLKYRWIVSIEDKEKFYALLRRIRNLVKSPSAIRQGQTRLRVVHSRVFCPQINLQINDASTVILGFSTEGEGLESGVLLKRSELVGDFQRFFNRIWENSTAIIEPEVRWDNLRRLGTEVGVRELTQVDEIENEYERNCAAWGI